MYGYNLSEAMWSQFVGNSYRLSESDYILGSDYNNFFPDASTILSSCP